MSKEVKVTQQRAVIAAVQLPTGSDAELESSLDELRELAKMLGFEVVATVTQKRGSFDSTAYLGAGKREELRRFVQGEADETDDAPPAEPGAERRIARHGAVAAREAAKAQARTDNSQAGFRAGRS
jgi:GTP-binding protein HflX